MIRTDRVFGLVVVMGALAYFASALQIQTSFMSDPVGPRMFPTLISAIAFICGVVMVLDPDEEPGWPGAGTLGRIAIAAVVMVAYALTLKAGGFLVPTAVCAAVLSYQMSPRVGPAALTGLGLAVGLFVIFKFILGLGLSPWPSIWLG